MSERIQKLIANAGYGSRRWAERLIEQGRISINKQEDFIKNIRGLGTSDASGNYRLTGTPLAPRTMGVDVRYKF